MLFERVDTTYLLIAAALIIVGVAHYWLARWRAWAGAFVPVAYLGFLGWLFMAGGIRGLMDIVLLLLGFASLLVYWAKAREASSKAEE